MLGHLLISVELDYFEKSQAIMMTDMLFMLLTKKASEALYWTCI